MSLNIKDRIYQETETEGTGKLTLTAVKQGYQGFVALPNGSTTYYCITNDEAWEVGQGRYINDGTDTLTRELLSSSTGDLIELKGNSSVFCTYPAEKGVILNFDGNIYLPNSNVQGQKFIGDGSGLTNINAGVNDLVPEAPADGETYARDNKTWVSISDSAGIPDAPVDDLTYGRKNGEWDTIADASDIYTKAEIDAQQKTQDDAIVENNDDIARQQIEINNQNTSISKNTSDIDEDSTRIASNTTAIGTLSGQVGQNSEDIAELQDSIFFSSAYSADYPSTPNRDPEEGNMYLQNFAMFTYSYADATQIFASKTDESGNVRQFTAIKAGDSIVLNEVDSPNYGRYELVSVEDVSDSYVVMNVLPKLGQGTVITGAKVAFQAFPQPGGGTGDGIPEAPVDGKQYGRQDATWTEVVNGEAEPLVWESDSSRVLNVTYTNSETVPIYISVYVHTSPASLVNLIVDGVSIATVGDNYSTGIGYDTMFAVVPAGKTYQMTGADTNAITGFHQAKVSVGGGGGSGGTTEILPVLMSGEIGADGSVLAGTGFTVDKSPSAGVYTIKFDKPFSSINDVNFYGTANQQLVTPTNKSITQVSVRVCSTLSEGTPDNTNATFAFQIVGVTPISVGGGSGDAEAPVILKATFSVTSAVPGNAWMPITFDEPVIDTNNCLDATNKWYKPNVAGYYNVALSTQTSGTSLTRGISGVWKNDVRIQQGTETFNDAVPISSVTSLTNTIVYCNGTTDYIQSKVLCAGASDLKLMSGYGTQLNISRIASSLGGVEEAKLCKEIYPNNYTAFSSQTFALLDNSTLTADVKAGRKYIVTGGTDLTIQNITAVNTTGYMKIAISEDGGAYVDTRINVAGGAKTADGGTGWIGALERTFIYEPTTSASIKISMYGKVGGAGASCAFNENTIRIQEV